MKIPRILLAAGASGSGKTLITCGILEALVHRGKRVASFKCGPDYIDPMFHSRVIGTKSRNLDTFFTSEKVTNDLLRENAADCDLAVMEGVMGYYDGVAGTTSRASAYDLADVTNTPVIFIVNSKGMSLSLVPYIKGFLEYRADSRIRGIIFNQMSPMLYPRMKALVEAELPVKVLGYVPKVEDCVIESRHLGLVLPEELPGLRERLHKLGGLLEKTLDMEGILELAEAAPEMAEVEVSETAQKPGETKMPETAEAESVETAQKPGEAKMPETAELDAAFGYRTREKVRVGVARDEAFCFFYEDNFRLLQKMGAELVFFSPIHDRELPENLDGLLLYGGYPELHAEKLEENSSMREAVRRALEQGMPCMAECGGFMYLHEEMEDMKQTFHRMCGVIAGKAVRTPKLSRFGYVKLQQREPVFGCDDLGEIPAHEFHYFDSTSCGESFLAKKPESNRSWQCIHGGQRLMAGFPHVYYYGNPRVAKAFLIQCELFRSER